MQLLESNITIDVFRIDRAIFAGDMMLLGSSEDYLQHVLNGFTTVCCTARMRISVAKTVDGGSLSCGELMAVKLLVIYIYMYILCIFIFRYTCMYVCVCMHEFM